MFLRLRYPGGSVFIDEGDIDKIKHYVENFSAKPDMISDTELKKYSESDVREVIGNKLVKNELYSIFGLNDKKKNTMANKASNTTDIKDIGKLNNKR